MDEYPVVVFWSVEDEAFIADAPDLMFCSAHGETPEEALAEIRIAMRSWLETARDLGKPIPIPTPSAKLLQRAS